MAYFLLPDETTQDVLAKLPTVRAVSESQYGHLQPPYLVDISQQISTYLGFTWCNALPTSYRGSESDRVIPTKARI